jgi:membrane-bound inhibitor of C-type lysozyme
MKSHVVSLALVVVALSSPAGAAVGTNLSLTLPGDAEKKTVVYGCDSHAPITVTYVNAAPNFLAIVPITNDQTNKTEDMIMSSVITGSGVRYEAGQYLWWNKGNDGYLYDVTEGADAAPLLTCSEQVDTP